jgi:hypothetical protein
MDMKCLSESVRCSCQSTRSAERSISSAVQKDATCCLYMLQRSECSIGKSENRVPLSSFLQMSSTKSSSSDVLLLASRAGAALVDPPRAIEFCEGRLASSAPPRNKREESSGTVSVIVALRIPHIPRLRLLIGIKGADQASGRMNKHHSTKRCPHEMVGAIWPGSKTERRVNSSSGSIYVK